MPTPSLSRDDARRIALRSQGLAGTPYPLTPATSPTASRRRRTAAVDAVLQHLGAVQLDTISVLARSHELIAYSRLGAVGRPAVEEAYWNGETAFEYWSHAACILPVDLWPWFGFRRRHFRARGVRWHEVSEAAVDRMRARLRLGGPATATELGGAKAGGEWWDWSDTKVAVEWLLDVGEVVVTRRQGWRRVYDLAERAIPSDVLGADPTDDECRVRLVAHGARRLGVGTERDIADVHRLKVADVRRHAADAGLVEIRVDGWRERAWAHADALEQLGARGRNRTTLLSPFDSLVWHRPRAERIFGMSHRLEAYTPAERRVHGYFAMPVLHGGQLVARVDPARDGSTLVARTVTLEADADGRPVRGAIEGTAAALQHAASWVACDGIAIEKVRPEPARAALAAATA